jgi:hypothetical protein
MAEDMNFNKLLNYIYFERTKKPRKARVKAKKYNTGKLSEEEILMYRQLVNDENFMNEAIQKTAEKLTEVLK